MKCPHCLQAFHGTLRSTSLSYGPQESLREPGAGMWLVEFERCPACSRSIIFLRTYLIGHNPDEKETNFMAYPRAVARTPLPPAVPGRFGQDYREACLVLADSPKASAALSRRCLQDVLRDAAGTKAKDLAPQIDEVLPTLPPGLRDLIDAVRTVGNFAAHPIKSTHTGEIIDVEPGEAELLLDVLEMAFDFYFVQPAEAKKKRDALNAKLAAAGKPPMK